MGEFSHCYLSFYQKAKRLKVETNLRSFNSACGGPINGFDGPMSCFRVFLVALEPLLEASGGPTFNMEKHVHAIWTKFLSKPIQANTQTHQKRPAQWIGCMDFLHFGIVAAQAEALQCTKWPAWESSIVVLRQCSKNGLVESILKPSIFLQENNGYKWTSKIKHTTSTFPTTIRLAPWHTWWKVLRCLVLLASHSW